MFITCSDFVSIIASFLKMSANSVSASTVVSKSTVGSSDEFIAFSSVDRVKTTFEGIINCVKSSNDLAAKSQLNMMFSTVVTMFNQLTTTTQACADMATASKNLSSATSVLTNTNSILVGENLKSSNMEKELVQTQTTMSLNNLALQDDLAFYADQLVRNFKSSVGYGAKFKCSRPDCKGCMRVSDTESHKKLNLIDALNAYCEFTRAPVRVKDQLFAYFKISNSV